MLRIALGTDHRGGKTAEAIVSEVLFREKYASIPDGVFHNKMDVGYLKEESGIIDGNSLTGMTGNGSYDAMRWVGAVLITCEPDEKGNNFTGIDLETIEIPTMVPICEPGNGCDSAPLYRVDYPDIAAAVAQKVSDGKADYGILVCGTGIGMCIVANKFRGVRAAACHNEMAAELSRRHNNANILCIPGEMLGVGVSVALVRRFLTTSYDGGRHQFRVEKINNIEQQTGL